VHYRITSFLERIVFFIFFLVLALLIGVNIFTSRGYTSIDASAPTYFNLITVLIAGCLIFMIRCYRERIMNFFGKGHSHYWTGGLLLFSLVTQLAVIKLFSVNPTWDFGVLVNGANEFLATGEVNEYFNIYPNNILLLFILSFIGKVTVPHLLVYELFNVAVILVSQYLIFRIASKLAGNAAGVICLLGSVLFFPYIFYAPIVYTDTVSLIFLLVPLNFLISRDGHFRGNALIVIAASVILSFGMLLKGSLVIFIIALSITLFFYMKKWRKLYLIIPFLILLISKSLFNLSLYQTGVLDEEQIEQNSFPITHWMVMAQNEDRLGKYAQSDVDWTKQLLEEHPKEDVKDIHLQELKNRIDEKGFTGNVKFNLEKLAHTWSDGTYYSLNKLRRYPQDPENFESLVNYKSGHLVQGYARVQQFILLFGLVFTLALLKQKESRPFIMFAALSIIGFFFFFLIWETRSRYLVSVTPLIILLSGIGYFKAVHLFKMGDKTND
jgi:4-amino-4-deoxy-L-arabinose transferase-like glycosyltransferase